MRQQVSSLYLLVVLFLLVSTGYAQSPTTISWGGYEWSIRSGSGGPGPNTWNQNNVFVDANGYLHLQIKAQGGTWSSAELDMVTPVTLGFGTFQFHALGRPDLLDPNTVFGFFLYPPTSVGQDGTNEIDIEFSRWGNSNAYNGNYTVWPTSLSANRSWSGFNIQPPSNNQSTHRFVWTPNTVSFQSFDGFRDVTDNSNPYASWVFDPANPPNPTETGSLQFYCSSHSATTCISQNPQYFIINLWQFQGQAPASGTTQEVVLTDFQYVPYSPGSGSNPGSGTSPGSGSGSGCDAAWVSTTTYPTGSLVSYNGTNYQANYPTSGDNPAQHSGAAGSGQPWLTLGSCGTGTTTPPPPTSGTCSAAWNASTVYYAGNQASEANVNYQASYWTQGNDPSANNGPAGSGEPWQSLGSCSSTSAQAVSAGPPLGLAKSRVVPAGR